jgi:hypothetical protein
MSDFVIALNAIFEYVNINYLLPIVLCMCLLCCKNKKKIHTNSLQEYTQPPPLPKSSYNGIFEIHITVDREPNVLLLKFVSNYYNSLKIIHTITSIKNNQYMISRFTRENSIEDAIKEAKRLEKDMKQFGLNILRNKVEYHGNEELLSSKDYFEFHVKINCSKSTNSTISSLDDEINSVRKDIKSKYPKKRIFIGYSYNVMSRSSLFDPIFTIRIFETKLVNAICFKDIIINRFKKGGYRFGDKLQQEVSIYDTNTEMDNDWLK